MFAVSYRLAVPSRVQLERATLREHRRKPEPTIPGKPPSAFGACADGELRDDGHLVPTGEERADRLDASEEERPE